MAENKNTRGFDDNAATRARAFQNTRNVCTSSVARRAARRRAMIDDSKE
jgi:hypothetical protein